MLPVITAVTNKPERAKQSVILSCHLLLTCISTFYDHNKLAVLLVFPLLPKFLQHTAMQVSHTHCKTSLFPLVECYIFLASSPIPFIYSKLKISYPLLLILPLLHMKSHHQDNESCPLFLDYLLPPPIFVALPQLPSHTWTSKVIFCSSHISEPQTSPMVPPFTTLTSY